MSRLAEFRFRAATGFQRHVGNPVLRRLPRQTVLETTGRVSGLPRQVPVGGRLIGTSYWLIAGDGWHSSFVRNIEAHPAVRVFVHGRWRVGTAHLLPDDDPRRRLWTLNPANGLFVAIANPVSAMLTVRIDLAGVGATPS